MDDQKAGEKLYAGKYKTIEELEAGYKNAASVYDENQDLKKLVEDATKVPDNYMNPDDVEMDSNRITDIQARAKEAGMTQKQYESFLRSDKARLERNKANFTAAKKEVGEETINILTDYVAKHYPKELQENMINTFIGNKEARQAALNHRQQLLNNRVPGMDKPSNQQRYTVTDGDIKKAYEEKEKNPHDMKARQRYVALLDAKANQDKTA